MCFFLALFFRHIGVGIVFQPLSPFSTPFALSVRISSEPRNFLDGFTSSGKMVLLVARTPKSSFLLSESGL